MTAGTGDDKAAGARPRRGMRASDADRERAVDILKAAYVYGLVTKDELGERVGQALASRTRIELALITDDLPAGLAGAPPLLSPPPATANLPARVSVTNGDRVIGATLVLSALIFIAAYFTPPALAELLSLGAAGSALVSLFLATAQVLRSRRDNRSGGQAPPRGAISTGRSPDQRPQISQPRQRRPADAAPGRSPRPQLST